MRSKSTTSFRRALLASAIALAAFASAAQAQTYNLRVLHRFSGAPDDGASPTAAVEFDTAGNLYGTTAFDGAHRAGTIFEIAKDGTETIVHSFDGAAGGSLNVPDNPVTIDQATGDLYGATSEGGGACDCGVLYELAADGTFTVLHTFDSANDGGGPSGRLLRDQQGNLYGTAENGSTNGHGTVYRYGADGSFTVLHSFAGTDGDDPVGGVIRDRGGNLYGVTSRGGPDFQVGGGYGTVYRLAPDGNLTTLYSFTGGADYGNPAGGLTGDQAGNLYGAASGYTIAGMVFKLAPDGTFTAIYRFTGGTDGGIPNGGLLRIGGSLYGTTAVGGDPDCHLEGQGLNCGVVFKIAPDGAETVLYTFTNGVGIDLLAGLTYKYGRLFGTTYEGGGHLDGTVYSVGVDTQ